MTAVVCWGGPLHDRVVDVPAQFDTGPLDVFLYQVDENPVTVAYRAVRLADAPGRPLARDRREPSWWWVYVPDDDPDAIQRHLERSRTPLVDGPRKPHPVVVARGRRLADPEHDVVPARAASSSAATGESSDD